MCPRCDPFGRCVVTEVWVTEVCCLPMCGSEVGVS